MTIEEILLHICAGDETEAEEAFCWLYRNCWEEVLLVLKYKETFRGLSLSEKETAVSMAFKEFWDKARAGNIRDMDKDPRALLHVVARRRATDLIRKKTTQKRSLSENEWKSYVNQRVEVSSFRSQLCLMERNGLAQEVMDDFLQWLKDQKGIRLQTAQAIADFFPDFPSPKELFDHLYEVSNPPPTYDSVKKARADVLAKFKSSIESKYQTMWQS